MKLIILDIDETLVYASEKELTQKADLKFERFYVYKRPYLEEFLELCFRLFNVAIWTSSSEDYAEEIINGLHISKQSLSFLWARKRCTWYYEFNTGLHIWVKNLRKVKRLGFPLQDIIVIDDSPEKHIKNYGNLVSVLPFYGCQDDQELLFLSKYLLWLDLQPNIRSIEKRFWKLCL